MLDIALLRDKPEWVKEQIAKLNDNAALERIDLIVNLDGQRRELLQEVEALKGHRNRISKASGRLRGDKKTPLENRLGLIKAVMLQLNAEDYDAAATLLENPTADPLHGTDADFETAMNALFALMKELGDRIDVLDEQVRGVEEELNEHMLWVPNMPHASVPVAMSDAENIAHAPQGIERTYDFTPQPHWELGPALNLIDFERGVKLSGSRFYVLNGMAARLLRALGNFMLDELAAEGFTELYVPHMLRETAMYGSGQFPKFIDASYKVEDNDYYLIPTSEVAIVNMYADEVVDEADLPLNLTSKTPCFRQEKMSAGRDVRGIKRGHQFEKVEMIKLTTPETSYAELEKMTATAERLCGKLGLRYRRLEIVTGDLGFTATKKYDIEAWAPGCDEWLEISSCSNCEDFQTRRINAKYRPTDGGKPRFLHTLNGSAFGMSRLLIAIMETYQQADGTIVVPEVLRPYMGGVEVITRQ